MSEPTVGPPITADGPPTTAATPPRRTHSLTPVVEAVRGAGVLVAAIAVFGSGALREAASAIGGLTGLLLVIGALVLVVGAILGWEFLAWSRQQYFFDDSGDFRLDSGVLQRTQRRVTLSRLQTVDVVRPLLGRVVGLSQVRVEVAGGGDTRVVLSYLTDAQAQALRAEIIARAAGVDPQAGEAPEAVLASVPTNDLIMSLVLRSETFLLLLASVLVVVGAVLSEGPGGLGLLLVTGGLPILSVFTQFSRFFGFTLAESPDGLRLRHGLASVESQTVPPGRVQAVEVEQPLLWRRRGWVRVNLNVAGVRSGDEESRVEQVLLPVAPREVAAGILGRVLPGVQLDALEFSPPPPRAHRRAWLQFRNLGVTHDERVFATSRGFLTRRVAVIPHARTQSVRVEQGPWQRALGLASVIVDSTPGPVSLPGLHRDAGEARAIAEAQLQRAALARASHAPDRWMRPAPDPQHAPAPAPDPLATPLPPVVEQPPPADGRLAP